MADTDFEAAVNLVLKHEGGLLDDPETGELSNHGISLASYPELGRQGIIDLTTDEARAIYRRDFWDKYQLGRMPAPVSLKMLDIGINIGMGTLIGLVQDDLGLPVTHRVDDALVAAAAGYQVPQFRLAIVRHWCRRVVEKPVLAKYVRGWCNRLYDGP